MIKKALIFAAAGLAGCATSNYETYFRQTGAPSGPKLVGPYLTYSSSPERLSEILNENGYRQLGYSDFQGEWEPRANAISYAQKIGADLIVFNNEYKGSKTINYAYAVPTASTSNSFGTVRGSNGVSANYAGTSTTYGSSLVMGQYDISVIRQKAFYFAREEK